MSFNIQFESKKAKIGIGLFSKTNFKKGTSLLIFKGNRISVEEANKLYNSGFDYLLQVSDKEFILIETDEKFINHSCNPNSAFLNNNGELVALRDIQPGEELTFDYSLNENTEFEMNCDCGSPACRKKIGPFYKLSDLDKNKVKSILAPHLR